MSYHVTRTDTGSPRIVLHGEPTYCKAFEAAPSVHDPELRAGQWLVMAFAAWSMPDINAVQAALDAIKHFGGRLSLGLWPFDDTEELRASCPGLKGEEKSPVWVLLSDGQVRFKHQGALTTEALVSAIEATGVP